MDLGNSRIPIVATFHLITCGFLARILGIIKRLVIPEESGPVMIFSFLGLRSMLICMGGTTYITHQRQ